MFFATLTIFVNIVGLGRSLKVSDGLFMGSIGGVLFLIYFAPAMVASYRGAKNIGSVFVINLFLGWTLVGWVVALAMAFSDVAKDKK